MKNVPRIGRVLDLMGLALFLVGAGLYGRAWMGLRALPAFVPDPAGEPWAAIRLANGYVRLQGTGRMFMAAGMAVFVAAWWVARRAAAPAEAPET
ncbi:MAG: hypothetical protein AMXMBFR53_20990 [Gemmatimonadota bacterium]